MNKIVIAFVLATAFNAAACGPSQTQFDTLQSEIARLRMEQGQAQAQVRDTQQAANALGNAAGRDLSGLTDAQLRRLGVQRLQSNQPPTSGGEAPQPVAQQPRARMGGPLAAMQRMGMIPARPVGVADDAMFIAPPWDVNGEAHGLTIGVRISESTRHTEVLVDGRRVCAYGGGFASPQRLEETATGGLAQDCAVQPVGGGEMTYWMLTHNVGRHIVQARFLPGNPFTGTSPQAECEQLTSVNTGEVVTLNSQYATSGRCR